MSNSFIYMPARLHVMKMLQELIEGAKWGDGTLAGRVSRGKILIGDEIGPGPWVNILESPRPDFPAFAGGDEARADEWVILLEGVIERDEGGHSDPAYFLQAEVELQLGKVYLMRNSDGSPEYPDLHRKFAGTLTTIKPFPPVIRPVDNMAERIAFYQPITLGMAGILSSPFIKVEL